MKTCPCCKISKPLFDFSKKKTTKDGLYYCCKLCKNAKQRARVRLYPYDRAWNLKKRFGLTIEQYNKLELEQNGVCKICNKKESVVIRGTKIAALAVDHCHVTGKIRGLLCGRCNMALGKFEDNVDMLKQAIKYLEDNNET